MGVLFWIRALRVVFREFPTFLVKVELRSVLSLDTPRAVYEPPPSTPLIPVLVLEPDLVAVAVEGRSVRPNLEFEPDLFKPGVVGSSVALRAVKPPRRELELDLARAGFSAAVASASFFAASLYVVFRGFALAAATFLLRVLLRFVLAGMPVFLETGPGLVVPLWRSFRSSSRFFCFSLIRSAFETILPWPGFAADVPPPITFLSVFGVLGVDGSISSRAFCCSSFCFSMF